MILTVEELRRHVDTDKEDQALEDMLQALESSIKGYTNNNFKRVMEEHGGQYPPDVKMGVVELLRYDLGNEAGTASRGKIGIASETISRHSVTYVSTPDADFSMCYPKRMLGFLKPYICARFGQGLMSV